MIAPQPPSAAVRPAFCALVLGVIVLLFAVRNLPWHLDDLDQAKQAFTSFQIVHGGSWFYQQTPDGDVATKPPFAAWISTLLFKLWGGHGWDFAWRLPSFGCALLVLFTLARSGEKLFGNNIGVLLAAGAFGLNTFTPRLATLVRTDMLLTTLIFFIGWLAMEKLRSGKPWTRREQWITFALFLAALMTKGPIVYAFILPGWLAFHYFARRMKLENRICAGWWTWVLPLLVFGFWTGYGIATDADFYKQVVGEEFLGRFTVGDHAKHHNFFPGWYALNLLVKALPWSLLFVLLFTAKNVRTALRHDSVLLWLVCWTFGGLLFMEFVPSKRFDRIFPVLPPACLLLAAAARYLPDHQWRGLPFRRLATLATIIGLSVSIGYAGLKMATNWRENGRVLVKFGHEVARVVGNRQDRLAVIGARDEGLLLYTDHPRFDSLERALELWQSERIDWLVVGGEYFSRTERKFEGQEILGTAEKRPAIASAYRFLKRLPRPPVAPGVEPPAKLPKQ
jgi:4-amino-4-deoxy-L-arabinose transferase-like glycosyltransferase